LTFGLWGGCIGGVGGRTLQCNFGLAGSDSAFRMGFYGDHGDIVIVANMCLSGVVIDVNISLLPLVSTVSYFVACIEDWIVEDIEKIKEDQCMWTIWLSKGLSKEAPVKF